MSIIFDKFNRRMFLRGLGGIIACPFLESLVTSTHARAAAKSRKRFIAITTPDQMPTFLMFPDQYKGYAVPADIKNFVADLNDGIYPYRRMSLAQVAATRGRISTLLDSRFNSYADKIAIYRGIDMPGRIDHGRSAVMGNLAGSHLGSSMRWKPMRTMDEYLANSMNFYSEGKAAYRYPVLRLGESQISVSNESGALGIGAANSVLSFNGNLKSTFDNFFSPGISAPEKKPVVDRILVSTQRIMNSGKLSAQDKLRLGEYLDRMNDLEKSISQQTQVMACAKPSLTLLDVNGTGLGNRPDADTAVSAYYKSLAEIASIAIKCDLTKIITIGIDSSMTSGTVSACHARGGESEFEWHGGIGHKDDYTRLSALNKFIIDEVFYKIMESLNVPEAGGETYLDNTLMTFTSEMSAGHSGINYTGLVAGNRLGGVQNGYGYEYGDWNRESHIYEGGKYLHIINGTKVDDNSYYSTGNLTEVAAGQPINRFWVGVLQSLGLTPQDYLNKYGNGSRTFGVFDETYTSDVFGSIRRGAAVDKKLSGLFG